MGAGTSAQTVQEHLDKQEALIKRLQTAVEKQGAVLGTDDDEPERAAWPEEELGEELHGRLDQVMMAQQKPNRPDPQLDDEEKEAADAEWGALSEEEAKKLSVEKPWLVGMAKPSGWAADKARDAAPAVRLELEHVYGGPVSYAGRNVLALHNDSTIISFAGSVGIVHDFEKNTQRFMAGHSSAEGHSDDILSIAYHPGAKLVATGQLGKGYMATVCVWSAETLEVKAKLAGFHTRGVCAIAFNDAGSHISSLGLDPNHGVAVYDWGCAQLAASADAGPKAQLAVRYEPGSATDFVTVGVDTIFFWSRKGGDLACIPARIGRAGRLQPFLSVGFVGGSTLIGTSMGELYLIGPSRSLAKVVDAHNGPVACIAELPEGGVITGGKDGFVSLWDTGLRRSHQWNMSSAEPGLHGVNKVRSIAVCGSTIVVGCINATRYRVSQKGGIERVQSSHFGDLSAAHQYGELWALAPDPKAPRFATVCDDATLRIWDARSHACVSRVDIGATTAGGPARALSWSPDGRWLVAGFLQGSIAVFDAADCTEVLRIKKRKRRIQCMAFSPCSKFLAVGSAENQIDLYDTEDDFRRMKVCGGRGVISSVVMQIDWSEDSKYIQATSQAYELMHFEMPSSGDADSPKRQSLEAMKDVKWATSTCVFGWDVQGIWSSREFDGSDINAVCRSNAKKHLATADTYGNVKLFNYPCVGGGFNKAGELTRRPECNHVSPSTNATNVVWSADDQYVYSTGGSDLAVFQWKVVPAK